MVVTMFSMFDCLSSLQVPSYLAACRSASLTSTYGKSLMVWTQPWQALVTISMSVRIMVLIIMRLPQFMRSRGIGHPGPLSITYQPDVNSWHLAKFVTVVRKVAKRGDVAKLLKEYDLLLERMARFFSFQIVSFSFLVLISIWHRCNYK